MSAGGSTKRGELVFKMADVRLMGSGGLYCPGPGKSARSRVYPDCGNSGSPAHRSFPGLMPTAFLERDDPADSGT
eukprot:8245490-Pyramimonas_sp.AAC.1